MDAIKWIREFPIAQYAGRFASDLAAQTIRTGRLPQHIAFVMDGNRRYAKKYNLESGEGHYAGFENLVRILTACAQLGIKHVTVYAFSIENFNRKQEESNLLFNMIRTRVFDLVKDKESVAHKGAWKVRILGNLALLEPDVLERLNEVERKTKDNNGLVVNICCPYTSRDDLANAVSRLSLNGDPEAVTEQSLENNLYLRDSPPLDILVRTSGETRLSDFMLWESVKNCQVHFVDSLWPEFSSWHLFLIVMRFGYQHGSRYALNDLPPAPLAVSVGNKRNRTGERDPTDPGSLVRD